MKPFFIRLSMKFSQGHYRLYQVCRADEILILKTYYKYLLKFKNTVGENIKCLLQISFSYCNNEICSIHK